MSYYEKQQKQLTNNQSAPSLDNERPVVHRANAPRRIFNARNTFNPSSPFYPHSRRRDHNKTTDPTITKFRNKGTAVFQARFGGTHVCLRVVADRRCVFPLFQGALFTSRSCTVPSAVDTYPPQTLRNNSRTTIVYQYVRAKVKGNKRPHQQQRE